MIHIVADELNGTGPQHDIAIKAARWQHRNHIPDLSTKLGLPYHSMPLHWWVYLNILYPSNTSPGCVRDSALVITEATDVLTPNDAVRSSGITVLKSPVWVIPVCIWPIGDPVGHPDSLLGGGRMWLTNPMEQPLFVFGSIYVCFIPRNHPASVSGLQC